MKRLAVSLLLLLASISHPGHANTFSTDSTDLWYNAGEPGWGANLVQQNEIIFVTLFVYSQTGQPTWFVGPATVFTGSDSAGLHFSGPLYATTGPYYGGPFNSSAVGTRQVGTVSFVTPQQEVGRLTYTVDGVQVIKDVTRQTFRDNNVTGAYLGGWVGTYSGCSSSNGYREAIDTISINHSGSAFTMQTTACTYNGTYVQDGRLGRVAGSYYCTNAVSGNFLIIEMEASLSGMDGRLETQSGSCSFSGRIGGVKRQQ